MSLHSLDAGKIVWMPASSFLWSESDGEATYECITHLHGALIRLLGFGGDIEVPHSDGHDHPQDNLSEVLSAADTSTNTEGDHLLSHANKAHE